MPTNSILSEFQKAHRRGILYLLKSDSSRAIQAVACSGSSGGAMAPGIQPGATNYAIV